MVIDWANGKSQIKAPQLQNILKKILHVMTSFESVSFTHIYKEINGEADLLSKLALDLQLRVIEVEEFNKWTGEEIFYLDLRKYFY